MYKINLGSDGRVLCAYTSNITTTDISVDTIPEGNISDYRYVASQWIYDPLPTEDTTQPIGQVVLLTAQIQALASRNEFLEDCIAEMAVQVYGV